MVRKIVKDTEFLSKKSLPADELDLQTAQDLQDTLRANREKCVGLAANMIGVRKNMIVVSMGLLSMVMINPEIIEREEPYEVEEGCLSLEGMRWTVRYKRITVRYQDVKFQEHTGMFADWMAQIIQHECDHLEGILI